MEATPILISAPDMQIDTPVATLHIDTTDRHINTTHHELPVDAPLPVNYLYLRRGAEIAAVLVCAPVWLPAIGLFAAISWMTERKQVFFIQKRPGRNGELFKLIKFRTMYLRCDDSVLTAQHDKRVTPLGHFLRRHKLDELPQLFNVLKGDMSLIGPRPVPENFYHQYLQEIPAYDQRHVVKPGITGLAQVCIGYTETLEGEKKKLQYDLQYIKQISLRQDLIILGRTFRLLGRNQKQ